MCPSAGVQEGVSVHAVAEGAAGGDGCVGLVELPTHLPGISAVASTRF